MEELELYIIENVNSIRLVFFIGVFLTMGILEYIVPRRELLLPKIKRWFNNISLIFLDSFIVKLIFSTGALGASIYASNNNIGLFNSYEISTLLSVFLSIIILDFIIYWQHRLFHKIDFFWNFHNVHHSDMDYDVTTAVRFHPIEIVFSMVIKIFFILLLGVPLIATILFEIILSSLALFNHSNIFINKKFDNALRYIFVTPDMHRIHHSIYSKELNSNYGFNISLWDRLFNSYTKNPKDEYSEMIIGLKNLQDENKTISLLSILKLPFIKSNSK